MAITAQVVSLNLLKGYIKSDWSVTERMETPAVPDPGLSGVIVIKGKSCAAMR